jgi:hypothetical protein
MARSNPLTIILERVGDLDIHEAPGKGTIYPGYLLKWCGASNGSLVPCGTAGLQEIKVAIENPYSDDNSVAAVDKPYNYGTDKGETVRYIHARRGDLLYMYLDDGSDATSQVTYVQSHDDGTLQDCASNEAGGTVIFGQAESAEATSTGGTRIKVRVF